MPIYKVQAPDGTVIKVEAPEGASQDDLISFAQANWKAPATKPQAAPAPAAPAQTPKVGGVRGFLGDMVASGARYSTPGMIARLGGMLNPDVGATPEQVDEFAKGALIGAGKTVSDLGQGARLLAMGVGNSPIMPTNALLGAMGRGPMVSNESYDKMMGELQQKAQTDKGLENVPGSTTGQLAGNLALGLALPVRGPQAAAMAAKAPLSTAMGTGAAYGMGFGALTPQTEQSQLEAGGKSAAIGAAIPLGMAGVGKAAGWTQRTDNPLATWMRLPGARREKLAEALAGSKPNEIAARIENFKGPEIPGLPQSAAQIAREERIPNLAAFEGFAKQRLNEVGDRLDLERSSAMSQALRSFGKTPQDADAAEKLAKEAFAQNFGKIASKKVSPEATSELMQRAIAEKLSSKASALQQQGKMLTEAKRPSTLEINGGNIYADLAAETLKKEALSSARESGKVAAQRQKEANFLKSQLDALLKTDSQAEKSLYPLLARPSGQKATEAAMKVAAERGHKFPEPGENYTIGDLQIYKKAMDKVFENPAEHGLAGMDKAAQTGTRQEFVKWLEHKAPEWARVRDSFKSDMVPVTQMRLGQQLEKSLYSPLARTTDDIGSRIAAQKLQKEQFARAFENAPQTIKGATNQQMYKRLEDALLPENFAKANAVRRELSRDDDLLSQAQKGSPELARIFGMQADQLKVPTGLNSPLTVSKAIINMLSGGASEKAKTDVAQMVLTNPQAFAALLRRSQDKQSPVSPYLNNFIATQAPSAAYRSQ